MRYFSYTLKDLINMLYVIKSVVGDWEYAGFVTRESNVTYIEADNEEEALSELFSYNILFKYRINEGSLIIELSDDEVFNKININLPITLPDGFNLIKNKVTNKYSWRIDNSFNSLLLFDTINEAFNNILLYLLCKVNHYEDEIRILKNKLCLDLSESDSEYMPF